MDQVGHTGLGKPDPKGFLLAADAEERTEGAADVDVNGAEVEASPTGSAGQGKKGAMASDGSGSGRRVTLPLSS